MVLSAPGNQQGSTDMCLATNPWLPFAPTGFHVYPTFLRSEFTTMGTVTVCIIALKVRGNAHVPGMSPGMFPGAVFESCNDA